MILELLLNVSSYTSDAYRFIVAACSCLAARAAIMPFTSGLSYLAAICSRVAVLALKSE